MLCTIALESKIPRIAGPGAISAGHPGLTHAFDTPCIPRIGEVLFLEVGGVTNQHVVTSVRYVGNPQGILGASVLVTDGVPVQP